MRGRSVLVLAAVVAALLAFVWFYERELPSSDDRIALAKKVLRFEQEEVSKLTIERLGEKVTLERPSDGSGELSEWQLVAPLQGRADSFELDGLLSALSDLAKERTLEEVDREAAGLALPRATVELETPDEVLTLLVGSQVPASETMIVAAGTGGPAFVVEDTIWEDLTRPAGEWRSRDVFSGTRSEVDRIAVATSDGRLLLATRGEEFWVEAPYVDRADGATVTRLVNALSSMEVDSFVDREVEPTTTGLEEPRWKIEVVLKDEAQPFVLELGATIDEDAAEATDAPDSESEDQAEPTPVYWARSGEQVFTVESDIAKTLSQPVSDWRSFAWTSLEVFETDRVQVTAPESQWVLVRSDGDWLRDDVKIDFATANDFLYAVTGTKAERTSAPGEVELGPARMTLVLANDEVEERVEIFAAQNGAIPVTVTGRDVVLWVPSEKMSDIEKRIAEVTAAEVVVPQTDGSEAEEAPGVE